MTFGWNYPPGVTGNEIEIAGPDFESDDVPDHLSCVDHGDESLTLFGYGAQRWVDCNDGESHEIARWDVEPEWEGV